MNVLFSLTALVTPLTMAQIRAIMVKALVALGVRADLWLAGGAASSILTVAATIGATASTLIATSISGFFLPISTGTALQLLAVYVYGIPQSTFQATFASGNLLLTNTGGAVYSNIPIGGYSAKNPITNQTYTNTAVFSLGAVGTPTASASVPVQATQQGSIGNANPATVTAQVTMLLGVTVTNPASLIGIDAPADGVVRQLCLNSLGARSVRGVRTAYQYAVQTAVNSVTGQPVNINRWTVSEFSSVGLVTIYLASPSGAPSATDVAGVAANVEAVARPSGVTVVVTAASTLADTDALTVYCIAPIGATPASLAATVASGISSFISNYPIGGLTANDGSGPTTGLFASAIIGNVGASLQAVGAGLVSVAGANDHSLSVNTVITDSVAVNIVILNLTNGTTVI